MPDRSLFEDEIRQRLTIRTRGGRTQAGDLTYSRIRRYRFIFIIFLLSPLFSDVDLIVIGNVRRKSGSIKREKKPYARGTCSKTAHGRNAISCACACAAVISLGRHHVIMRDACAREHRPTGVAVCVCGKSSHRSPQSY